MTTLAIIPARGGSQELRRKNLLPDANGVPLVLASARAARDAGCRVVVSTDDPEVMSLAELDGHLGLWRRDEYRDGPVDAVVADVVAECRHDGPVLLVQPTVQPITADLLAWFLREQDSTPMVLGVEDRHLTWHDGGVLTDRLERQTNTDWPVREVGIRWWPSAPLLPPERVITSPTPLVDIDSADDYRRIGRRLNIQFEIVASPTVGHGHLHRALTLAEGLQHHNVGIRPGVGSSPDMWAFLEQRGWSTPIAAPDVLVRDTLDTPVHHDGIPQVAMETTRPEDVTINALYGHGDYVGARYAVLRPEFTVRPYQVSDHGLKVMVMFGGTDPSNLTRLTQDALPGFDLDIIRPADRRGVAAAMHQADLLITSGGRTVFEAAAVGIPTIVMSQNMRETTHTHLGVGNIDLGLGRLVAPGHLRYVVESVLGDYDLRRDLSATARASIDGQGADRVRSIIEHVGYYGEKP